MMKGEMLAVGVRMCLLWRAAVIRCGRHLFCLFFTTYYAWYL